MAAAGWVVWFIVAAIEVTLVLLLIRDTFRSTPKLKDSVGTNVSLFLSLALIAAALFLTVFFKVSKLHLIWFAPVALVCAIVFSELVKLSVCGGNTRHEGVPQLFVDIGLLVIMLTGVVIVSLRLLRLTALNLLWIVPIFLILSLPTLKKVNLFVRQGGSRLAVIAIGGGILLLCGLLTWWQVVRIHQESYWVIFHLGGLPIPAIGLTGYGCMAGVILVVKALLTNRRLLTHKKRDDLRCDS